MKNAIYLQYEWFSGDVAITDDQRNDYIYMLQDNEITQQFCDIGVIQENGTLLAEGYAKLGDWIHMSHMVDASQKIVPVLNYGKRKTSKQFGTAAFNSNVCRTVKQLVNTYRVDGIHLDIEGFINNDNKLIALLKQIKGAIGNRSLSISTPATVWDDAFVTKVAQIVDQMNPMIYDTMGWGSSVVDEASYKEYFKNAITRYAGLVQGTHFHCDLVPTLPSYELKKADDGTIYHDPAVESMKAAISAINESVTTGITGAGIFYGSHFLGLNPTIYSQYPQDQEEWKTNFLKQ